MITIEGFERFEQPVTLIKLPRYATTCSVQIWRLDNLTQAEELFTALVTLLSGDSSVGPIALQPKSAIDSRPCVILTNLPRAASIRVQIARQLDPVEPIARKVERALVTGPSPQSSTWRATVARGAKGTLERLRAALTARSPLRPKSATLGP